jgi:putative DNA primase/helicase
MSAREAVELYTAAGWPVIPLDHGKKDPPPKDFTGSGPDADQDQLNTWVRAGAFGNIAVRCPPGVIGLDVDDYGDKRGGDTIEAAEAELGPLPNTWCSGARLDSGRSMIAWYRLEPGLRLHSPGSGVDLIQRHHRYGVVWPSIHPEGMQYVWFDRSTGENRIPRVTELAELPQSWVDAMSSPTSHRGRRATGSRYDAMVRQVMAVVADGQFDRLLGLRADYVQLVSDTRSPTVAGAEFDRAVGGAPDALAKNPTSDKSKVPNTFAEYEDAIFVEAIGKQLSGEFKYANKRGWLRWKGTHWFDCSDAIVIEAVRECVLAEFRSSGFDVDRMKKVVRLMTKNRLTSLALLARGLDAIYIEATDLDREPDLLNTASGVVDLRTAQLQPHEPGLLLTKCSDVAYVPGATHADWVSALEAVDEDVRDWLKIRFGQAATGHPPDDDLMPILNGGGSNGKTTLLQAVMAAIGSYGQVLPEKLLKAGDNEHPTLIADLDGLRLAVIEETPEARQLNTQRLKDLLGTPTLKARRMRQDYYEFKSSHSLFLATNYRPVVYETDHGTWRRLALVPFPYRYRRDHEPLVAAADRRGDVNLRSRLRQGRAQREAVLAWLVEGALAWYVADRKTPAIPQSVANATDEWRSDSDPVVGFLREFCEFGPNCWETGQIMRRVFNGWLEDRGHQKWSETTWNARFANHDALSAKNATYIRGRPPGLGKDGGVSRHFRGVCIRALPTHLTHLRNGK